MFEWIVRLAGLALWMICLANLFCFEKLEWNRNLGKVEEFFGQVFKVHALFLVMAMLGMGAACLFATEELMTGETMMAKGFTWFGAIFWGVRVVLHLFYYEKSLKQANPCWNALFFSTFVFLCVTFVLLGLGIDF
ncbi:hypothetical protein OAB00_01035 [Akkermansiaceae bacterium]|nr:hypothetical protein [Akkermansiaceae bacterium]